MQNKRKSILFANTQMQSAQGKNQRFNMQWNKNKKKNPPKTLLCFNNKQMGRNNKCKLSLEPYTYIWE